MLQQIVSWKSDATNDDSKRSSTSVNGNERWMQKIGRQILTGIQLKASVRHVEYDAGYGGPQRCSVNCDNNLNTHIHKQIS